MATQNKAASTKKAASAKKAAKKASPRAVVAAGASAKKKAAKKAAAPAPEPNPTPVGDGPPPLADVRVLDLTDTPAGAAATALLTWFGADVIKIEPPDVGEEGRALEPHLHGVSAYFTLMNRGKRSVALDLSKSADRELLLELAETADVVIESRPPGALDALDIGYAALSKRNSKLVYAALTPYGQTGPDASRAGRDLNQMALSGALGLFGGEDGSPVMPGAPLAEYAGLALPAVIGILLALRARETTGEGQMVDAAALDGMAALLSWPIADYAATRRKPMRGRGMLFGELACYNIYPARNSRWLVVGALEPAHWKTLCKAVDRAEFAAEQFAPPDRQRVITAELTRVFQRKDVSEWMELFQGKDVCVDEVRDLGSAVHHPHLIERGAITQYKHPQGGVYAHPGPIPRLTKTPGRAGGDPPAVGEHNDEVLAELGSKKKKKK